MSAYKRLMNKAGFSPIPLPALESPAKILRQIFLDRKERNAAYSSRSFARDLGMSQTLLSLVLNGKRPLTVKQAAQISILLELTSEDTERFLELTLLALPENSKGISKLRRQRKELPKPIFMDYAVERFKVISQWYHLAILDLTTTATFKNDQNWIAKRLGVSTYEVRDAIERLIALGFLEKTADSLRKVDSKLYFATQASESAVRNFHKQMIDKAKSKLDETRPADFAARDISSITMAVRKDRIAEAKTRIKKFQMELATFLTEGECDEVYQMNMQLFGLTKNERE